MEYRTEKFYKKKKKKEHFITIGSSFIVKSQTNSSGIRFTSHRKREKCNEKREEKKKKTIYDSIDEL